MTGTVVTFTANPSIDRTIALEGPLERGEVQRAASVTEQAAGKGVNVAKVTSAAGVESRIVLPFADDRYLTMLSEAIADRTNVTVSHPGHVRHRPRTNTTITEPDGTTTKINEPGPTLSDGDLAAAAAKLLEGSAGADWVVLSGSLPPGAPEDWYVTLTRAAKAAGHKVAIDTSDAALDAVLAALPGVPFDLIKPNSDELAQLTGGDAAAFEASAKAGDLDAIVAATRTLAERGIANVLVTLGGAGAVLVNAAGAWYSTAPDVEVKSTVGAGDSSVAGFIIAEVNGEAPGACLASAVAYGSGAAGLPGTTLPRPEDAHPEQARVTKLA
nr:1-phosphofructokinase [Propionibacterium sp.]